MDSVNQPWAYVPNCVTFDAEAPEYIDFLYCAARDLIAYCNAERCCLGLSSNEPEAWIKTAINHARVGDWTRAVNELTKRSVSKFEYVTDIEFVDIGGIRPQFSTTNVSRLKRVAGSDLELAHVTYHLGECHELGLGGLIRSVDEAQKLYEKAASLWPPAQMGLGRLAANTLIHASRSLQQAFTEYTMKKERLTVRACFEKAAAQGFLPAIFRRDLLDLCVTVASARPVLLSSFEENRALSIMNQSIPRSPPSNTIFTQWKDYIALQRADDQDDDLPDLWEEVDKGKIHLGGVFYGALCHSADPEIRIAQAKERGFASAQLWSKDENEEDADFASCSSEQNPVDDSAASLAKEMRANHLPVHWEASVEPLVEFSRELVQLGKGCRNENILKGEVEKILNHDCPNVPIFFQALWTWLSDTFSLACHLRTRQVEGGVKLSNKMKARVVNAGIAASEHAHAFAELSEWSLQLAGLEDVAMLLEKSAGSLPGVGALLAFLGKAFTFINDRKRQKQEQRMARLFLDRDEISLTTRNVALVITQSKIEALKKITDTGANAFYQKIRNAWRSLVVEEHRVTAAQQGKDVAECILKGVAEGKVAKRADIESELIRIIIPDYENPADERMRSQVNPKPSNSIDLDSHIRKLEKRLKIAEQKIVEITRNKSGPSGGTDLALRLARIEHKLEQLEQTNAMLMQYISSIGGEDAMKEITRSSYVPSASPADTLELTTGSTSSNTIERFN